MNVQEWNDIEDLYKLIYPINIYTNKIQKNNASLYTTLECFNELLNFYKSNSIPKNFKEKTKIIVEIIDTYWNKYIDEKLMAVLKLFCFTPNIQLSENQYDFLIEWGILYLKKNNNNLNDNTIRKNLISQLNKFMIKQDDFIKIEEYITEIKDEEINSTNISYISKLVWGRYIIKYNELSNIAIAILYVRLKHVLKDHFLYYQIYIH